MLDGLTLDQMRAFLAVAESGSFRRGAARLSRVQSAISHAIGSLEDQLGVRLFDRSGHRPALTPEGRALLTEMRAILAKVDAMRARARSLGEGLEAELRVAVDSLFPLPTLATALAEMHKNYPTVGAGVFVSSLGGPIAAVRDRHCTLGISIGDDIRDASVEMEALPRPKSMAFVAVAAAGHPLGTRSQRGQAIGMADLADHVQIVVEDPSPLTEGRDFSVFSTVTWRVSDMESKRALILAGLGWGKLMLWSIERDLAAGRLVRIGRRAAGWQSETLPRAYLVRRSDAVFGPAARRLREMLLKKG
jgi:DNA-binding transcriptional LysR family regulator